jgi:hypothetical protein
MSKYIISLFLINAFVHSYGQRNMISLSGEYNMVLGEMKWSYKPATGIQLHFMRMDEVNRRWTKAIGLGIGYTKFNNLADTLYYIVDKGGVQGTSLGTAVYSPFRIFMFTASLAAYRHLSKRTDVAMSLGVAYYYGKRDVHFKDALGETGLSEVNARGTFVPKLGLTYHLNNIISITPFVSYTLMVELGSTNPDALNYNPDTGAFMYYYSTGIALNFCF